MIQLTRRLQTEVNIAKKKTTHSKNGREFGKSEHLYHFFIVGRSKKLTK